MSNYNFQNLRNNSGNDNKKLLITIALSMGFLTIWNIFTAPSEEEIKKQKEKIKQEQALKRDDFVRANEGADSEIKIDTKTAKKAKKEVFINTYNTHAGVDVANNRLTFLALKNYKQHNNSVKNVVLLDNEHFIESGFLGTVKHNEIDWKQKKTSIVNQINVVGEKNNVKYETIYTFNDDYTIKIKQVVENRSGKSIYVGNYSRASLKDTKDRIENGNAFRGIVMLNDGQIKEIDYSDIKKQPFESKTSDKGWISLSDQYWLTALISPNKEKTTYNVRYNKDKDIYQIDFNGDEREVKNGEIYTTDTIALVSPKQLELLQAVGERYDVEKIDKAIDFGIFYFLSKPLLIILKKLHTISGNFGIAIILLTILVRMIIFPLATKSYRSMAKMKKVAPRMKELQEQYKDDKKALQNATYQLYKDNNINPMSAMLPLFLQIPIFFALYKVLVISIEMRDAPFVGWIVDLSSKDPSSIFNLFGLLNFSVPPALQIGLLPTLMGLTMFIQQLLQPAAGIDKTQQQIIRLLPLMLTIMFASMPAGLVLYWCCSNVFTIFQQIFITKMINWEDKKINEEYARKQKEKQAAK